MKRIVSGGAWAVGALAIMAIVTAPGAEAQSTNQQIEQMEKQLDMNAKPDMAALGFQDDLATLEQCQSGCKPLIERMLAKYKTGANFGGNSALGAGDIQQLAAALASAAATLPKDQASAIANTVATDLGPGAATAYQGAYDGTVAPYDPK